jgi:hypothetical protein
VSRTTRRLFFDRAGVAQGGDRLTFVLLIANTTLCSKFALIIKASANHIAAHEPAYKYRAGLPMI